MQHLKILQTAVVLHCNIRTSGSEQTIFLDFLFRFALLYVCVLSESLHSPIVKFEKGEKARRSTNIDEMCSVYVNFISDENMKEKQTTNPIRLRIREYFRLYYFSILILYATCGSIELAK